VTVPDGGPHAAAPRPSRAPPVGVRSTGHGAARLNRGMQIPDTARAVLTAGHLAHLATIRRDGRPHTTEGGAPALLQELAQRYVGPGTRFRRCRTRRRASSSG